MSRYYDIDGNPLELMDWALLLEHRGGEGRIGNTTIGDVQISTVWLGIDHSSVGGPPLIFETMVYGGLLGDQAERYSTKEQAAEGHARWVAKVESLGGVQGGRS